MKCSFCGENLPLCGGKMFVKSSGEILYFCSKKCERYYFMGRKAKKLKWVKKQFLKLIFLNKKSIFLVDIMGVSRVKDVEKEKEKVPEERKKVKKVEKVRVEKVKEIVRIADTDVDATKPMIQSLQAIKGISYAMAKAICQACNLNPKTKLNQLSEEQIKKVEEVIKDPGNFGIPSWMLNRRKDIETGKDLHLTGAQLDITTKFDIQREIDLKTWKGVRHMLGLPVRGQRTRAHFRTGKTVGVMRKAAKLLMQKAEQEKKKEKK